MKITFLTEKRADDYERHIVLVNGEERIIQREKMEVEDVLFCRDLRSPHDCDVVIRDAIAAVKRGEEVEFEYVTSEDFV